MSGNLTISADIAASGMRAQAERLKVIAQNMANADSVSTEPGGEPYRRQVVSFQNYVDQESGAQMVRVDKVVKDFKTTGALCDVAPTVLDILGIEKPAEMTGESLIIK